MVTREGLEWIGRDLATRLVGARLRVGDAETALSQAPEFVGVLEGADAEENVTLVRISLTANFGPNEANGEWSRTQIVLDGKVLDDTEVDLGRKAAGSAWTLETFFDLAV